MSKLIMFNSFFSLPMLLPMPPRAQVLVHLGIEKSLLNLITSNDRGSILSGGKNGK